MIKVKRKILTAGILTIAGTGAVMGGMFYVANKSKPEKWLAIQTKFRENGVGWDGSQFVSYMDNGVSVLRNENNGLISINSEEVKNGNIKFSEELMKRILIGRDEKTGREYSSFLYDWKYIDLDKLIFITDQQTNEVITIEGKNTQGVTDQWIAHRLNGELGRKYKFEVRNVRYEFDNIEDRLKFENARNNLTSLYELKNPTKFVANKYLNDEINPKQIINTFGAITEIGKFKNKDAEVPGQPGNKTEMINASMNYVETIDFQPRIIQNKVEFTTAINKDLSINRKESGYLRGIVYDRNDDNQLIYYDKENKDNDKKETFKQLEIEGNKVYMDLDYVRNIAHPGITAWGAKVPITNDDGTYDKDDEDNFKELKRTDNEIFTNKEDENRTKDAKITLWW